MKALEHSLRIIRRMISIRIRSITNFRDDLRFVYEDGLSALPTFPAVLAYPGFWMREPQYGIDWKRVLHVEQSVELHRPLPVEGRVRSELSVDEILDKGADKGAILFSSAAPSMPRTSGSLRACAGLRRASAPSRTGTRTP